MDEKKILSEIQALNDALGVWRMMMEKNGWIGSDKEYTELYLRHDDTILNCERILFLSESPV